MNLPKIEHAEVTLTEKNCIVIKMEEGWRFWNKADYRDENGEIREPEPKEIVYGRLGIYSPSTDFSLFVVIAESDIPTEPETEPQTTE